MTAGAVQSLHPGDFEEAFARQRERLQDVGFERRLLARDPTLWPHENEIADRLGWLELPASMASEVGAFADLADEIRGEIDDVLVFGMGGSSLGAEVMRELLARPENPRLTVLDTTHPAAVAAHLEAFDPARTLHVVSSKSGTTLETLSLFRSFWERSGDGSRFVAITDPGTPLAALAAEHSFRRTFLAPADVGGRFSALSPFGLVPAALVGGDLTELLAGGAWAQERATEGAELGALLAAAAVCRCDKVTFAADPELASFLDWAEQLIAESTGKEGSGLVPVFGEPENAPPGEDRVHVELRLEGSETPAAAGGEAAVRLLWPSRAALGAEMMRWEIATAAASWLIGVNPFDQPDVERAKQLARSAVEEVESGGNEIPTVASDDEPELLAAIAGWLGAAGPGDYIAIQAFLPAAPEVQATIDALRSNLAATGLATTVGYGPRYLHSTGQLHKGGRAGAFCLQLVDGGADDLEIPGAGYGYRRLIDGQATGDAQALLERGRPVLRVRLGG